MKKIKKILKIGCIATFLFGFLSFLNPLRTSALTDVLIKNGGEQLDDFAFYRHKTTPSLARSHRIEMMKMRNSNKYVYCIQPGTSVYDGYSYDGFMSDYEVVANLTPEQWRMIALISYYGFEYVDKDANIDHTASKWYSVTQMLIWQYATTEFEIYFSKSIRNERIEKYTEETAEVLRLVEEHSKKPNFGNNIVAYLGGNLILNDSNNVLKGYKIISSNNVNASIDGNTLNITPTSKGDFSITLQKENNKYDSLPIVYINANSQNVMAKGNLDPSSFIINGTTKTGALELKKYDSINKTCTPQKGGSLSGSVYKLYKEDGTFVQDLTIGSDCSAKAENLNIGRYYVLENKAGTRYELDTEKHYFSISNESPNASLTVYDKPLFGSLKLKKYDSITKTCTPQKDGRLEGTIYKLYKEDGSFVRDLVIGSNCETTAEHLDLGRYYLLESQAGTRYELDLKKHYFDVTLENLNQNMTLYDNAKFGRLNLKKVDSVTNSCVSQENSTLEGAIYKLYKDDGTYVKDLIIDSNCSASADNLDVGRYYILESKAPLHYELDTEKHYFDLTVNQLTVDLVVKDTPMFGQVSIEKHDSKNHTCTPRGNATLVGAIYGIYKKNGEKIAELTIGNDCKATSEKNLIVGEYYLQEITAPKGYKTDMEKHYFSVTDSNYKTTILLTVEDDVYTTTIHINKTYLVENGVKAEVGATFDIISKTTGKVVATITIDDSGNGSVTVPYDEYRIHQTTGVKGYKKSADIDLSVNENVKNDTYYALLNEPYSAKVRVIKKDNRGNTVPMAGIHFKIYDVANDRYVCQNVTYPNVQSICEFVTDENGEFITPNDLFPSTYLLEEVDQPLNGYLWNETPLEFVVDETTETMKDKDLGEILVLNFVNEEVTGKIEIFKKGEELVIQDGQFYYEEIVLPNIEFGLYDTNGNLVETLKTDSNGYASIENLKLGKYILRELNTEENYILDNTEYEINLEYIDQYTPIVTQTFHLKNYLKKGTLEFSKLDYSTSEPIPNTKMEIYTEDGNLVYKGVTDENGKIVLPKLLVGKYYIVEVETADPSYLLNEEKMYFEVKENGDVVKSTMLNKKITGGLEFKKTDFVNDEPLPNTKVRIENEKGETVFEGITDENGSITIQELVYGKYCMFETEAPEGYVLNEEPLCFEITKDGEIIKAEMKNERIKGNMKFYKTDENGNPLKGVTIRLYKEDGTELGEYITDENGIVYVENLEYGNYYISEVATIEEYDLSDEIISFTIKDNGVTLDLNMVNVHLPNTGLKDYEKMIGTCLIMIGSFLFLITTKKQKRTNK